MSLDVSIGRKVRFAREKASTSIDDLAEALGVSSSELQAFETGQNRLSAKALFRVSQVLDLELQWFFDSNDEESSSVDCAFGQFPKFSGEYPEILQNLRLNKTLEDLCEAANQARQNNDEPKKVA